MEDIKNIWSFFNKKLKIQFIFLLTLILVSIFVEMISISMLIPVLNFLTGNDNFLSKFINDENFSFLIPYLNINSMLFFLLFIFFFKALVKLYLIHFQNFYIFNFFQILLNRLYKQYIYKDYLFHIKNNSSLLVRNLLNEIHQVSVGYLGCVSSIIIELFTSISLMLVLFIYNPLVTSVLTLVTVSISYVIIFFLKKKSKKTGEERLRYSANNLKYIMESLGGIKEIIINQKQEAVSKRFYDNSTFLRNVNYTFAFLNQLPKLIIELLIGLMLILALLYLVNKQIKINDIIIYFGLAVGVFSKIAPSINKISVSFISLNFYKPSVKLLYDEINYKSFKDFSSLKLSKSTQKNVSFEKQINVKNLSYSYDDKVFVLKNVNLTISKGEKIGILGESGSGKSTLAHLIAGILNPTSGIVESDGENINKNINSWYSKIGYVPQNIFLNDATLKENITFYEDKNNFNQERYEKAVNSSQLDSVINKINNPNYVLGERGSQISGGQLQRVGLARSLYKNSEILIFDEATTALDEENELNFINSINNIKEKKTIIIISHKIEILKHCERLLEVKDCMVNQISKI